MIFDEGLDKKRVALEALLKSQEKEIPACLDSEKDLLRQIITFAQHEEDPFQLVAYLDELAPFDWYDDNHREIAEAIQSLRDKEVVIFPTSLAKELQQELSPKDEKYSAILPYLLEFEVETQQSPHVMQYYVNTMKDKSKEREIIYASEQVAKLAKSGVRKPHEVAQIACTEFARLEKSDEDVCVSISDSLGETMSFLEGLVDSGGMSGTPTGFEALDELTCGWQGKHLIVLGARPSVGKTALALDFILAAAEVGNVVMFALEGNRRDLDIRFLSKLSDCPGNLLRKGQFQSHIGRLTDAAGRLSQLPIFYNQLSGLTGSDISSITKHIHRKHGKISLVVVDYIQKVRSSRKGDVEERIIVKEGTESLKSLAKELDIPVLALAQLNRDLEKRGRHAKRPIKSDLKESGQIEQEADIIMFLYRDDLYKCKDENSKDYEAPDNTAELIFEKHRDGGLGTIPLYFHGETTKFTPRG